jgi:hypothetical protein
MYSQWMNRKRRKTTDHNKAPNLGAGKEGVLGNAGLITLALQQVLEEQFASAPVE